MSGKFWIGKLKLLLHSLDAVSRTIQIPYKQVQENSYLNYPWGGGTHLKRDRGMCGHQDPLIMPEA